VTAVNGDRDRPSPLADADTLLRRAVELVRQARPMPLSSSVVINREEVLELLEQAVAQLPEELREARWLLKEREEFLERSRAEGDDIIAQASNRAEAMVQRTEVVRAADGRARRIIAEAEARSRDMRLEVEDYCDQRLASFEIALERVGNAVADARTRLRLPRNEPAPPEPEPVDDSGFYDQDHG
jgi:F0F1-type ATP synthase membrane subunit b/b'